jgi:hypothetical protein
MCTLASSEDGEFSTIAFIARTRVAQLCAT